MYDLIPIIASLSLILGIVIGNIETKNQMLKEQEVIKRKEANAKLWQQLLMKGGSDD